jgi:hypothetical protein
MVLQVAEQLTYQHCSLYAYVVIVCLFKLSDYMLANKIYTVCHYFDVAL